MSRKSILTHEYTQACHRHGAYATRQNRINIMHALTEALLKLRIAPMHWRELNAEILAQLVKYWHKKNIKTDTMATRMSVLRHIYAFCGGNSFPENQTLGIQIKSKTRQKIDRSALIIPKITHPIVQTIIDFETSFGLTKSESIKLPDYCIQQDRINIYRDIAFNNRDRVIPVTDDFQHLLIKKREEIINQYHAQDSLLQISSFFHLSELYRIELAIIGIHGHSHWRQHYAKTRFLSLSQTPAAAIKMIQTEMGLSSNRLLNRWLDE